MGQRHYQIQLVDRVTGAAIITAGGTYVVCTAGSPDEATVVTATGGTGTNPASLTRGMIDFYVDDAVESVDIHGIAPGGQWFSVTSVASGDMSELGIDTLQRMQIARIPYSHAQSTATTEYDTGFDLPDNAGVMADGMGVYVVDTDATETMDVGLLSSESGGDADGFMNDISIAGAATYIPAATTVTAGGSETYLASTTWGALVNNFTAGADSAGDVGTQEKLIHRIDGTAVSVSYTTSAGTDTGSGFILIPYVLAA